MGRGGFGIALRLGKRDAGLDPANHGDDVSPAAGRAVEVEGRDGVNLCAGGKDCAKVEAPGQHADDGSLAAIHVEGLANDVGVGVELRLPPGIADQDDGRSAVERILRPEDAAHGRFDAEKLKEVGDDVDAGGGYGCAAAIEAEVAGAGKGEVSGHILKGAAVHAELVVGVGGVGGARQAALGGRRRDPHQAIRVLERQRSQENRVDHAEDGDVGADAKGQDKDGDQSEAAIAAEGTEGIAQIQKKNVQCHDSSRFAMFVFGRFDAAESHNCLAAGFQRSEAAPNVFLGRHLDVCGDLGLEFGIERRLAEEREEAAQGTPQGAHQMPPSSDMASTRPITPDKRCQ